MAIINSLPRQLALTRLKANLFFLLLSVLVRTVFTPYTTLRRGSLWILKDKLDLQWAGTAWWVMETAGTALLLWNCAEAVYSLYFPPTPSKTATSVPGVRTFTPTARSSPLTRAYATPETTPASINDSTQTQSQGQQPSTSTPTRLPGSAQTTPTLSASTAKILNIPRPSTPSSTGLFYGPDSPSSPSKAAGNSSRPQQSQQSQPSSTAVIAGSSATDGDFVMIERDEKDWVDNVLKGVKGKRGRLGL